MATLIWPGEMALYILVIDQAWGEDGWIVTTFFSVLFCIFMDQVTKMQKSSEANMQPSRQNKLGQ